MRNTYIYSVQIKYEQEGILTYIKLSEDLDNLASRTQQTQEALVADIIWRTKGTASINELPYDKIEEQHICRIERKTDDYAKAYRIRCHDEKLDCDYYTYPEGSTRIAIHRHDENTGEEYLNELMVPANIYNADCDCKAIKRLFAQIVEEYCEINTLAMPETMTWNDFFTIPESFLRYYGVKYAALPAIQFDMSVKANQIICENET